MRTRSGTAMESMRVSYSSSLRRGADDTGTYILCSRAIGLHICRMAHVSTYFELPIRPACSSAVGCQVLSTWRSRCTPIIAPSASRIWGNPKNPHGKLENKPSLRTGKHLPTRPGDHERHILCIYQEQGLKSVPPAGRSLAERDTSADEVTLMSRGRVCQVE